MHVVCMHVGNRSDACTPAGVVRRWMPPNAELAVASAFSGVSADLQQQQQQQQQKTDSDGFIVSATDKAYTNTCHSSAEHPCT
jgi:hypothetical protein